MTRETPFVRHPILLSLWAVVVILSGLGLSNPAWFILVFLLSPILAVATAARIYAREEVGVLRPGWSIAYRIVTAGLALAGIAGVVVTAGRLAGREADWFANGPVALLFLLAFLTGWRALIRPSPRRAVVPAVVIHLAWLPLLIANEVVDRDSLDYGARWLQVVAGVSLIAILALSAFAAVLSLVCFHGEHQIAAARAARM